MIIVCGLGQIGFRCVELLVELGEEVSVIASDAREAWIDRLRELGIPFVKGDARSSSELKLAGIERASAVLVVTSSDAVNIQIAFEVRQLMPAARIVVRFSHPRLAQHLAHSRFIDDSFVPPAVAAPQFCASAFGDHMLVEFATKEGENWAAVRMPAEQAEAPLRAGKSQVVARKQSSESQWHLSDDKSHVADQGTEAVLIGPVQALTPSSSRPQSSSKSNRSLKLRNFLTSHRESVRSVAVGFVLLFILTIVSTAVFIRGLGLNIVDSFYFVVATISSTGYGDIHPGKENHSMKIFAAVIMIVGSGFLALLNALIIDAIVRWRLQQALGSVAVPESNHFVVVGYGDVGAEIVEELLETGSEIVVVDLLAQGPSTRRHSDSVAMISGDAREPEVLERANLHTAQALIVCTGDDATNVSVVLAAKSIQPKLRCVAQILSAEFAVGLQSIGQIDVSLSAPKVVAPLAVGMALHTHVVSAFTADGSYFVLQQLPESPSLSCRILPKRATQA